MSRILFWDSFDITGGGGVANTKDISATMTSFSAAFPKKITKQKAATHTQFAATDVKKTTKIFNAT